MHHEGFAGGPPRKRMVGRDLAMMKHSWIRGLTRRKQIRGTPGRPIEITPSQETFFVVAWRRYVALHRAINGEVVGHGGDLTTWKA
jgi:hypothetical protein